jgi:polysaccharide export outer membrane protein
LPAICLVAFFISSCVNTRQATYFIDQQNGSLPSSIVIPQTIISPNDLLSITVSSLSSSASAAFNTPNLVYQSNSTNNNSAASQMPGFLVDAEGNIQFPILGSIKAMGLTEIQLREQIIKGILDKKLLVDPIVTVRHLNFKVTVLGEVGNPTMINVPSEKINILEALGLAGDITVYGKRNNVMVIREENGRKVFQRLDLNKSDIFNSPYYYLRSNDIVYVEPNKAKIAGSSRSTQLLPIILSSLSVTIFVLDRIFR